MSQLRLVLIIMIASVRLTYAQPELPNGLIMADGGGQIKAAGTASESPARPGVLLYAGDRLVGLQSPARVLRCQSGFRGSVLEVDLTGSEREVEKLSYCKMPPVDRKREAPAGELVGTPQGTLEQRRTALQSSTRELLDERLSDIAALQGKAGMTLAGIILRASALTDAGLFLDAIEAYRSLGGSEAGYRQTAPPKWSANEIARLSVLANRPPPDASTARAVVPPSKARPAVHQELLKGRVYAVVIGVSHYQGFTGVPSLRFADQDALWMMKYLKSPRGKVQPEDVVTFLNADAGSEAVGDALRDIKTKGDPRNTLVVFFAGHGDDGCVELNGSKCVRTEKHLMLTNSSFQDAKSTAISMRAMADLVASYANRFGRVLLFVDACHSGHVTERARFIRQKATEEEPPELAPNAGFLGVLSASSVAPSKPENELAYEVQGIGAEEKDGMGIFTYSLIEQLARPARTDESYLSFAELRRTVQNGVHLLDRKQAPSGWSNDQELPVVDLMAENTIQPPRLFGEALSRLAPSNPELIASRAGARQGRSGLSPEFETAIAEGRLLPPDKPNAWDIVQAMPVNSAARAIAEDKLHAALADVGQQVIVRYLAGEQVTVTQADYRRCDALFAAALRLRPTAAFDESRMLFCRARALIFDGRVRERAYDEAEALLQQSIDIDPWRGYSWNALGISFLERAARDPSFYERAERAFSDAIRLAPTWAYPRHNRALVYWQRGQFNQAVADYRIGSNLARRFPYLPYNLGLLYQEMNRLGDAEQQYREALRRADERCVRAGVKGACRERAAPQAGLASLAAIRNKTDVAIGLFEKARLDDPSDLLIRHNQAKVLASTRDGHTPAVQLWRENLAQNPVHLPSLIGISEEFLKRDRARAVEPLCQIAELLPEYQPARVQLATALADSGHAEEALRILGNRPLTGMSETSWRLARAGALRAIHRADEAHEEFVKARAAARDRISRQQIRDYETAHLLKAEAQK